MRLSLLALLLLTAGCRTYGGYGTEEATRIAIVEAAERFGAQAGRLQSDLDALSAAAAGNPRLAPYVREYGMLVADQEALRVRHEARAVVAGTGLSYLALNRSLGAMIAEQQAIDDRLKRFIADIAPGVVQHRVFDPARYSIVPAHLARLEAAEARVTLREAIR